MEKTIDEILTSFSTIYPLWEDSVWDALQNKKFDEVENSLVAVFSGMTSELWAAVYWVGLVENIPAFRGELDLGTWTNQALPAIGKGVLKSASPLKILAAYTSLDLDHLNSFHSFLVNSIPGNNEVIKIKWLKENTDPLLVTFFLANPLGLNLSGAPISQNQIARLQILPENITSVLFSIQTPEIIKKIVEQNNIPQEKLGQIATLVGLVLLGFLHREELSSEINKRTDIPMVAAKSLFDSFDARIFSPIQSDLDKIYAPLPHEELSIAPVVLQDIGTASIPIAPKTISISAPVPKPQPISVSTATSQTINGAATVKGAAIANNNIPPTAPKVNRLSDVGWSRSRSADPVVKLDITPAPAPKSGAVPTPVPSAQPQSRPQTPSFQQSATPTNHALGEFERLNTMKKSSAVPTTATTPSPAVPAPAAITPGVPKPPMPATTSPTEPAPFMLHQDTSFKPQDKNTSFVLPKPGANAQVQMNVPRVPAPVRPAVLEFGASSATAPKPSAPANATSKAVHYTQFSPSLSSVPTANTGPRNISEVAAVPVAPKPAPTIAASMPVPRPPKPPMPPSPQAAQQQQPPKEKVIVQDFL